jgi:malate dehydrogenase (oxaloacetate-decarboxylating)(NADP+)
VWQSLFRNRKDVNNVYKYTAKGNLVAVINGTAVLGLEILVPEASKPVMKVGDCCLKSC